MIYTDNPNTPDVESGYTANDGKAVVVQITTYSTQFIRITFPTTLSNSGANGTNRATHWGIYMSVISPGKAAYTDNTNMPSPATFRRISIVPVEETFKDIKFTNALQTSYPGAVTSSVIPPFTNASAMLAPGGSYGQGVSGGANTMQTIFTNFRTLSCCSTLLRLYRHRYRSLGGRTNWIWFWASWVLPFSR